jgi:hypothetical protein
MPVGCTSQRSVQVSGFDDYGRLTPLCRLIRFLFVRPAFCLGLPSDSQSPATPLPLANTSPCRVCRGLSPPSHQRGHHSQTGCAYAQRAMPGAHRVGGGFTSAVLSHHRTYGSVYGGSGYATKPVYRIQYRDQPKLIPQFLRQRLIHM